MGNVGEVLRVSERDGEAFVANFPLATNEFYKNKEGEEVNKTEWQQVVFWNKAADIVEAYVRKGIPLYVEGKIRSSTWEDKEENKQKTICLNVKCLLENNFIL